MKKILIIISILITSVYLSSAVNIVLNSWEKLDSSKWTDLSSVLNKVDINWSDININGKLSVDWKICGEDWECLGACTSSQVWDSTNKICIENKVVDISVSHYHTFALKADGTLYWWWNNEKWQLWLWHKNEVLSPTVIPITDVKQIETWINYAMALKNDWTIWSWGENLDWELWIWNKNEQLSPVQITTINWVKEIIAWWEHSLAIKTDWTVWTWGRNYAGQLWQWDTDSRTSPVALNISWVKKIVAWETHSMAIKTDWTVWGWWRNQQSQLWLSNISDAIPITQIPSLTWIKDIELWNYHSVGLKNDGTVLTWWRNTKGQLWNWSFWSWWVYIPTPVVNLSWVEKIIGWWRYVFVIKTDWTTRSWWSNIYWQLWLNNKTEKMQFVQIPNF